MKYSYRTIGIRALIQTLWLSLILLPAGSLWINRAATVSVPYSEEILEAEQLLSDLGYWTGPIDGVFDSGTRHALIAFQKVSARKRTGRLTPGELKALEEASSPLPLEVGEPHIEVDLHRQVLFMVDSTGTVSHILPISSGNEKLYKDEGETKKAHTPRGRFKVVRKINGWRKSTLGLLYYPNYLVGGIAIHGNPSVPAHPSSHGCIRIPMFAAKEFSEMTPIGTPVLVHDGALAAEPR
jgi:hypothetical protein